jgi:hypothetical protein
MRMMFVILLVVSRLHASEIPTLHFNNSITWKQIFDFGFKPKHFEGLERDTCICKNQSFWVKFKEREVKFKVEKGNINFTFIHDDFLTLIWHQGVEAITLKEGEMRANEFRKVFNGYIVKEITMPRLIDPSGLVDANHAENNIEARIGEYVIWYGFDNSFGTEKPIIPHFYVAWSFPGKPDVKLKDVDDIVRPPKGYEWYSLDPNVNTPDLGVALSSSSDSETKELPQKSPAIPRQERRRNLPESKTIAGQNTPWGWWVGLFGVVTAVVVWFIRKLMNHPKR